MQVLFCSRLRSSWGLLLLKHLHADINCCLDDCINNYNTDLDIFCSKLIIVGVHIGNDGSLDFNGIA